MIDLLFFFTFIPIYIIQMAMPHIQRKTRVFGVSIPEPFIDDDQLRTFKWDYTKSVAVIQLIVILATFFILRPLSEMAQSIGVMIGLTVYLIVSLLLYIRFYVRTKQYKEAQRWPTQVEVVRVSAFETKFKERGAFPHFLFIPPLLITAVLIGWTISIYPQLPEVIPTHWNIQGEPDAWSDKSIGSVFMLSFVLIGMQVMMYAIAYGIFNSAIQVKAQQSDMSLQRELEVRKLNASLLGFINIITVLFIGSLDVVSFWNILRHDETLGSFGSFVLYMVAIFGSLAYYMRRMYTLNAQFKEEGTPFSEPDQDKYWKGGLFYFNKDDHNVFVEKNVGVGWTINFARPAAWFFILFILFTSLLPLFFL